MLGAAVLDDVMGVVLLALLYEFSIGGGVNLVNTGKVLIFVAAFFVLSPVAAKLMSLIIKRFDASSEIPGLIPTTIVSLVLFFAWLAHAIGAPELLGGFAAGLALSRRFFLPLGIALRADELFAERIETQMKPIVQLFTPIFFVMVGLSLNLREIDWSSPFIWVFSLSLLIAAVVGKFFGALLVKESWPVRWMIGTAMIPRGEVGLIFAELGRESGILSNEVYAGMVIVIALTTLLPPFVMKWYYRRYGERRCCSLAIRKFRQGRGCVMSDNGVTRDGIMDTLLSRHWHHLPREEIATLLESDASKGLDTFEVSHRQKRFGPNRITLKKGKGPLLLFLLQFNQPLVYILLGAAAITFVLQEWVDSGVIFAVVLVNAIIGFIQESKALKAIEALARTMEGSAMVVRAGKKEKISATELVPGDLVLLQSGDKLPADLRLVRSRELQIDESALTGESVPVQKQAERLAESTVLADRSNMAYSSTLVTYGTGSGIVVATGDGTEIGQINALIASADTLATPLTKKIAHFSGILLWIILVLAGLTLFAGWMHGEPLLDTFMAAVALAVGAIPEGLPAAMTIMLAIGVGKMARRNAIIRKMPAVETLGSTTVICSDKTGTLTQNQMTVQLLCAGGQCYEFSGVGYEPRGEVCKGGVVIDVQSEPALDECLKAGLLCNDSCLINKGEQWGIEGDPTEVALITAAAKAGLSREALEQSFPRIDTLPFESQHQYMATLHKENRKPRMSFM